MTVKPHLSSGDEYFCPGEKGPISRAVHLGRLAAFYPACRRCPRRDETGSLSPRQVARMTETQWRGRPHSLFYDEGAAGVFWNDLTPAVAKNIAAAFGAICLAAAPTRRDKRERGAGDVAASGQWLVASGNEERGERREESAKLQAVKTEDRRPKTEDRNPKIPKSQNPSPSPQPLAPSSSSIPPSALRPPAILLAGDGRPLSVELVAAAAEGLRSTGCDVIDIGPATAACLAFAVARLESAGGLLVGNPGRESHTVGMKFWASGARPLSLGGSLEPVVERYGSDPPRTARIHGALRRFQAEEPYLAAVSEHYHALRPLRMAVDSASRPALDYLQSLASAVELDIIPSRSARNDFPRQIRDDAAHLGVSIDGDGESCRAFDEQGRAVSPERLLLLLAAHVRPEAVVLETDTAPEVAERLRQRGICVATSVARRADMAAALRELGAAFGGGPSGRFWHVEAGLPMADALMTVTRLLEILSRADEPLSVVLDREASLG